MLILLSPSKTLDFDTPKLTKEYSIPTLLKYSQQLIHYCQQLTEHDISQLMKISPKLAKLNFLRFQQWHGDLSLNNACQAIQAFKGDVYEGLKVEDFTLSDFHFAQQHLLILSGLYGLLKPLDLILPYRLEMGIKLKNGHNNNLYQFWRNILTEKLNQESTNKQAIINLASKEYFSVFDLKKIKANIIEPIFLDEKKDEYKVISFYAKKARGLMSRYIVKNQLNTTTDLQSFNSAGYQFDKNLSNETKWIFKRSEKQAAINHNY